MDGVLADDIKIAAGDKPGTQKVTFKSSNSEITKEMAIKAIGDKKDQFVVKNVKKGEAAA